MYNAQLVIERVQSEIKQKKETQKHVLEVCGLSENTLKKMTDKNGIASFSLAKIADELECSVDYLLGRTNNPQAHIAKTATVSVGNDFNNQGVIGSIGNNNSPINIQAANSLDENDLAILNAYRSLNPMNRARLMVYADDIKKDEEKANEV
ncbi:MAG: helix-turn-helix domain-containing protein [Oscillospiraceae bacterium]|nr:helix-turn-helix domain-containing protein [Oscillospiraceae bacterium]